MRFLVVHQPGQVRPHGIEGIECHHGAAQVYRFQEFGEVAGLVVLDADLKMVQEVPSMFGDAEEMHPGAVGAAGSAGGLAIDRYSPQPAAGQRLRLLSRAPGTVAAHAG